MIRLSNARAAQIVSIVFFILSILFCFVFTPRWVPKEVSFGPSPQLIPNIVWILIAVCCLSLFVSSSREIKQAKQAAAAAVGRAPDESLTLAGKEKEKKEALSETVARGQAAVANAAQGIAEDVDVMEQLKALALEEKADYCEIDGMGLSYVAAAALAVVFYSIMAPVIHFIPTVVIVVLGLMLLYGQRKILYLILIPCFMSFGFYYFFNSLLRMVLP